MKTYRVINGLELSVPERILALVAQVVAYHTSCTDIIEIAQELRVGRFDVMNAVDTLERQGWLYWARVASLNNVHFASRALRQAYQQHPVKLVREYRRQTQNDRGGAVHGD